MEILIQIYVLLGVLTLICCAYADRQAPLNTYFGVAWLVGLIVIFGWPAVLIRDFDRES